VRTVIAAGLVLLTAGCSAGVPPQPGNAARPTTGSPRPATGTATPSPRPPGTAPGQPAAPALASVPVRAVPACAQVTCRAVAVVPDARPGIHLALVRGPDGDLAQTAYLLSLSATGRPLHWRRLDQGQLFTDPGLPAPTCDISGRCFVAAGVGAHDGVMNVIEVGAAGRLTDASQGGELAVDTPDLAARDLDGDGVDEVFGVENDYQPSYADGSRFWLVWSWRDGRYELTGCRPAQPDEQVPGGPVSLIDCPS
jgi:hypothetical protein